MFAGGWPTSGWAATAGLAVGQRAGGSLTHKAPGPAEPETSARATAGQRGGRPPGLPEFSSDRPGGLSPWQTFAVPLAHASGSAVSSADSTANPGAALGPAGPGSGPAVRSVAIVVVST